MTAAAPDAVVIQDQYGNVLSTSYANQATAAPEPSVSAEAASYGAPASASVPAPLPASAPTQAPAPAPSPAQPEAQAPSPAAPSPAPQAPSSGGSSAPSGGSGLGINYSPYHGDHSCKTADEVAKDFDKLDGFGKVRSYGTDCNQVPNIMKAAKAKNMKVMLGIYDIHSAGSEADTLIQGVNGDWGMVDTVSVGNEAVNSGQASAGDVVSAIGTVRSKLAATNYKGPVVAVDTFNALIANPQICQASDYAAANAHAFYDSDITPDKAGQWAQGTADRVTQACGKKTVITESGWPSGGSANGAAVPNPQNQQTAIESLKKSFSNGGLFLLSAYNDPWKSDFSGSFGCEKYWGIFGDSSN